MRASCTFLVLRPTCCWATNCSLHDIVGTRLTPRGLLIDDQLVGKPPAVSCKDRSAAGDSFRVVIRGRLGVALVLRHACQSLGQVRGHLCEGPRSPQRDAQTDSKQLGSGGGAAQWQLSRGKSRRRPSTRGANISGKSCTSAGRVPHHCVGNVRVRGTSPRSMPECQPRFYFPPQPVSTHPA